MYYYIVNPAAGRGQIKNLQDKLRSRLDELGIRGEWVKTTGPGEAGRIAAAAVASGHTTIVAVGGDDTVNEIMNAVDKDSVAIGIIPIGLRNRVAGQLGLYTWQQACDALAARRVTSFSLIAAGQKFFLSTLTLGFETDLDKQIELPETNVRGRVRQFAQTFGQARSYRTLGCKIEVDDSFTLECTVFTLAITNQKFLNPLADNRLIVTLSEKPAHRLHMGRVVWQSLRRHGATTLDDSATTRFLAKRVVIETHPATGIMVDGKVAGRTPIAIRLTDRRVKFITEKIIADFKNAVSS